MIDRRRLATSGFLPGLLSNVALLCVCLSCAAGCSTLNYYRQAVSGQVGLLWSRQPVARIVAQSSADTDLRQRLLLSQDMLDFVEDELGLAVGKRYRSYVALERDAVVVNLIATPPLSIAPEQWCYPVVGCAPYRGYFDPAMAQRNADAYRARGYTVYLSKAAAYSTLGWFDDPLLSTFINWPEGDLVSLLAHELAHSRVWVNSDVAFNEAFASFVGEQAAAQWLQRRDPALRTAYQARRQGWRALVALLIRLRERLGAVYADELTDAAKHAAAQALYALARACFDQGAQRYGGSSYRNYVAGLNDAALAVLATYQDKQPAFARLFADSGQDWPSFFAAVDELAAQAPAVRAEQLDALAEQYKADAGDHGGADQVECEALAHHGLDVEALTAVNDHVGGGGNG